MKPAGLLRTGRAIATATSIARRGDEVDPLGTEVTDAARRVLDALSVKVTSTIEIPAASTARGRLVCSNHLGYLDIVVLRSLLPAVFVAEQRLRSWRGVGGLMDTLGTIYVDRSDLRQARRAVRDVQLVIEKGVDVIVFPEGTPSRGDEVHPLRLGMFQAAVDAQADVLPVYLSLNAIDGEPAVGPTRDRVCWYRDTSGARPNPIRHLIRLSSSRGISMSVEAALPISSSNHSRKTLGAECLLRLRQLATLADERRFAEFDEYRV